MIRLEYKDRVELYEGVELGEGLDLLMNKFKYIGGERFRVEFDLH